MVDSKQWSERWQGNKRSGWFYRGRPVDDIARITAWIMSQVETITSKAGASAKVPVYGVWIVHGRPPGRRFTLSNGVHVVTPDNLTGVLTALPEELGERDVEKIRKAVHGRMKTASRAARTDSSS